MKDKKRKNNEKGIGKDGKGLIFVCVCFWVMDSRGLFAIS